MSSFTAPPDLTQIGPKKWRLNQDFQFHVGTYPSEYVITVKSGFATDLASIPAPLDIVVKRDDPRWAKPAILHDWLYKYGIGTKQDADLIFLTGMLICGTPLLMAMLMYIAVVKKGKGSFNNPKPTPA